MKAFNLKWLSIFGGMLATNISSQCGVGFFSCIPIGILTGFFLFNLCEYYSPKE